MGFAAATGESEAQRVLSLCQQILARQPTATIGIITRMGWRRVHVDSAFAEAGIPHVRWDLAINDPTIAEMVRAAASRLGADDIDLAMLRAEMLTEVDVADVDTRADVAEAIDQLAQWGEEAGSVRAALAFLLDPDTDAPIASGVHLLNAHVGKGQQFDWVFIPGFEDGHIPSFLAGERLAELLEEKRILLVMLSRARHGVVFSRAKTLTSRAGRPYSPNQSRWTGLVAGATSAKLADLESHLVNLPASSVAPQEKLAIDAPGSPDAGRQPGYGPLS